MNFHLRKYELHIPVIKNQKQHNMGTHNTNLCPKDRKLLCRVKELHLHNTAYELVSAVSVQVFTIYNTVFLLFRRLDNLHGQADFCTQMFDLDTLVSLVRSRMFLRTISTVDHCTAMSIAAHIRSIDITSLFITGAGPFCHPAVPG